MELWISGAGEAYETKYCCRCLVLLLFLSFLNAHDSICLILSLLTPISSPISCSVFVLPSSSPYLHLMTCFSLGFRLFNTFSRSSLMNCLISSSSDVSALGSAITSWKRNIEEPMSKMRKEDQRYDTGGKNIHDSGR